jgi:hypothetical protein
VLSKALISDINSAISPVSDFTDPDSRARRRAADLEVGGDGGSSIPPSDHFDICIVNL